MNAKSPSLHVWRSAIGLCMICGQPMGLKSQKNGLHRANQLASSLGLFEGGDDDEEEDFQLVSIQDDIAGIKLDDLDKKTKAQHDSEEDTSVLERMLLVEECPIRMAFLRFNMLGEQQDCHIIDQYTFLEKKSKEDSFVHQLREHEQIIRNIDKDGGCFSAFYSTVMVEESAKHQPAVMLDKVLATSKRIGDQFLFAGCRRCNMCMNKPAFHVDALYRCFGPTSHLDNTFLESRSVKAIKIKKIIQQIAFYFDCDTKKKTWKAKEPEHIILDVNLWRCISSLCCWSVFQKYRFRMIAIFYASHYLYLTSSVKPFFSFEDWHIHFFREVYMDTFPSTTFFGLEERDVKSGFNLSRKEGDVWMDMILTRLTNFQATSLEPFYKTKDFDRIYALKGRINQMIFNEFTLILFLSSKASVEDGVARLLDFFSYHLSGSNHASRLLSQCIRFQKMLCSVVRQEKINRRQRQQLEKQKK